MKTPVAKIPADLINAMMADNEVCILGTIMTINGKRAFPNCPDYQTITINSVAKESGCGKTFIVAGYDTKTKNRLEMFVRFA